MNRRDILTATPGLAIIGLSGLTPFQAKATTLPAWYTTLEAHGGAGDFNSTTGTGTDNSPAWDLAMKYLQDQNNQNGTGGTLLLGPKNYGFFTPPTPASGINIIGQGSARTGLIANFAQGVSGVLIRYNGRNHSGAPGWTGGGVNHVNLQTMATGPAGSNETNNYALLLRGDAETQPSQTTHEDVYITSPNGATWFRGLEVDGSARVGATNGIRDTRFEGILVHNTRIDGITLNNAADLAMVDLGFYKSSGAVPVLRVTGGTSANSQCTDISILGANVDGELKLENCQNVYFQGTVGTLNVLPTAVGVVLDIP